MGPLQAVSGAAQKKCNCWKAPKRGRKAPKAPETFSGSPPGAVPGALRCFPALSGPFQRSH
eukprot:11270893-Alexandrium_andersonii.AAC.1